MSQTLFLTTVLSGVGIAFVHTLIPVHWLPYALAGRARGWSLGRTLAVNAAGGVGHVLVTAVLGFLALAVGLSLDHLVHGLFGWLVVAVLVGLGLWFLYRQLSGRRCRAHAVPAGDPPGNRRSDHAATVALVTMLLFSPCEAFVPVYLAGGGAGWAGFLLLTAVLAVATMSCMLLLTALAWRGMAGRLAERMAGWQSGIVGIILLLLAAVMLWWHPG